MSWITRSALPGLAAALLGAALLGSWLRESAQADQAATHREHEALQWAQALAQTLADAAPEQGDAQARAWLQQHPAVDAARWVQGRELRWSSLPAEAAPRALARDEKAWFDLARQPRSVSQALPDGAWQVAVPLAPQGGLGGIVLLQVRGSAAGPTSWLPGLAVLLLLVPVLRGVLGRTLRAYAAAYAYVAPALLGMTVLVFFPFLYGIALSFTDTSLFNEAQPWRDRWVGLDNFITILGDFNLAERGPDGWVWNYRSFYWTLWITLVWTVGNVVIGVSLGLLLALALNTEGLRGKTVYRLLLILPWAIPNYITALVWRGMFHPQFGVINQALVLLGLAPVAWFDGVVSAFVTGLVTNGWLSFPFMMVVILGALQAIPRDLYEAAAVEGASRWQQLRRITLPLLRPTLVPAIVLSVVWTFNMFNIIFLVSGGEPGGANEILVTRAYKLAFENYQYAYAAAYSTVIFLILLVYGVFQTRVTRAMESW